MRQFRLQPQPSPNFLATLFFENLDGDRSFEKLIGSRVYGPHSAPAELLLQQEPLIEDRADVDHCEAPTANQVNFSPKTGRLRGEGALCGVV